MDENILIQGFNDSLNIEAVLSDNMDIEGLFSMAKKAFSKVKKVTDVAGKLGVLPPGSQFGLSTLESLSKYAKSTGKKVQLDVDSAKNVYEAAYLKGYAAALQKFKSEIDKMSEASK